MAKHVDNSTGSSFFCFDALFPSQQFFSHVRPISFLPVFDLVLKLADKVFRLDWSPFYSLSAYYMRNGSRAL